MIFAYLPMALAFQSANVDDTLNLLTDQQVKELQSLIETTSLEHNLDLAVVITDQTEGKSSRDFADDYYDSKGFGVGEDYSGLLLLINMKDREVWISTTGRAIDIFTDARINAMVDSITGFLSDGNYNQACTEFVNQVRNYAVQGVPAGQHRINTDPGTYMERVIRQIQSPLVYIIPLVIAIIATVLASLSSKGKVTINNRTYEEKDSFQLVDTQDHFIRESVTQMKIPNNPGGSGGGSSTHTGSSGSTHGGGGGRF
ncbi:MAG TPA: hypothetical protein DDY49_00440 [Paenibacillaceae bacterium]|nr:hypothetical protein [Paenibacillaceae bacterium]